MLVKLVFCGSTIGYILVMWAMYGSCMGHMIHIRVMWVKMGHIVYMCQMGIAIFVIYVIIMWGSQGLNGSYGSYMSQPRCIYKGHLGHIWTINHGSYMGLMGYYEGQKYELNGSFVSQPWCTWVI